MPIVQQCELAALVLRRGAGNQIHLVSRRHRATDGEFIRRLEPHVSAGSSQNRHTSGASVVEVSPSENGRRVVNDDFGGEDVNKRVDTLGIENAAGCQAQESAGVDIKHRRGIKHIDLTGDAEIVGFQKHPCRARNRSGTLQSEVIKCVAAVLDSELKLSGQRLGQRHVQRTCNLGDEEIGPGTGRQGTAGGGRGVDG